MPRSLRPYDLLAAWNTRVMFNRRLRRRLPLVGTAIRKDRTWLILTWHPLSRFGHRRQHLFPVPHAAFSHHDHPLPTVVSA